VSEIVSWDLSFMHCQVIYHSTLVASGAFTRIVKLVLSENLGGILGGTQCSMGDCLILSEC